MNRVRHQLREFWRLARETARLMIGIPDYDRYVARHRVLHPDHDCMTYEEFFRNRQEHRFRQAGKCC